MHELYRCIFDLWSLLCQSVKVPSVVCIGYDNLICITIVVPMGLLLFYDVLRCHWTSWNSGLYVNQYGRITTGRVFRDVAQSAAVCVALWWSVKWVNSSTPGVKMAAVCSGSFNYYESLVKFHNENWLSGAFFISFSALRRSVEFELP